MMEKPLEASIKRHNKKVYVTLFHRACNTVVEIGTFPEGCPVYHMTSWINRKNEMFPLGHRCLALADSRVLPVHRSAHASLF